MKKWILIMVAAATVGCAPVPEDSGFLPHFEDLTYLKTFDFFCAVTDPEEQRAAPAVVAINRVRMVDSETGLEHVNARLTAEELQENLYFATLSLYPSPTVVTREVDLDHYINAQGDMYRLEMALTYMDGGSGWARYIIGYYAGSAVMQVDFRLRDARTNRILGEFTARRLHAGDARQGFNLRALSNAVCLEELSRLIAVDAVLVMDAVIRGKVTEIVELERNRPWYNKLLF